MKRTRFMRLGAGTTALVVLAAGAGCSKKSEDSASSNSRGPERVKIALVPGGAHPYFQPWKTTAATAKTDLKLGDVTLNETSGWDQTKQNDVLKSLAAQGYNAFGVFGVSPENINSTFEDLKRQGFPVASLASCPAGDTDKADFCLSTDVGEAAYKAAKAATDLQSAQKAVADRLAAECDILIPNDHDYPQVSQQIIRMIRAETEASGGVPAV